MSGDCPPWINPGSAFRLVVKVDKYTADGEFGIYDMPEQQHDLWLDRNILYSIAQFHEDLSTKIIWGPSQTVDVWVLDQDTGSEWKIRRDEHLHQMILDRWDERKAFIAVTVVRKNACTDDVRSARCVSGVTNGSKAGVVADDVEGCGDTCSSPSPPTPQPAPQPVAVDWGALTILENPADDGLATQVVDEDMVFEAMGLKGAEAPDEGPAEGVPVPAIPAEIQADMNEAAVPVDDIVDAEPLYEWDRDNPDMSVGTCYPSMHEFRLAVRQHAIVKEFELDTRHSDKDRFRGDCAAVGCPWIIRAKTQHDGSVRIQKNQGDHNCTSTLQVVSRMASIAWVAERVIMYLRRKPAMGAKELRDELYFKYNIKIPYQTMYNGRQRAADKLFGKWNDSFDWLYRFKAEIELRSPGSVVEIDTVTDPVDGKIRFSRFFCAFKACIDGFVNGCRPYISIDSTALNGMWCGHMPAALALDGHNWMFPLAFGLFESESKENWVWFMEQLKKSIGPMETLAVCTDACKGLESSDIKCDYINNNLAESWNSWIKEHKDLPVHCMADAIREKIMLLFGKRRKIAAALSPGILPAIIHKLNAASRGLGHMKLSKGHPNQAEVTEVYKDEEVRRHVVYLQQKICTCRQWQLTGKPCPYALVVISSTRQPDMGAFVDQYYSVQMFQAAYAGIIPNITDRNQWPDVNKGFKVFPPGQKKKGPGKLRKNRIKSAREGGKATRQVKCPNCNEYGHRGGSSNCSLTGTKKRKRTKKTTVKVGRKKAKTAEAETPRSKRALAREAAAKARREAEEAEAKAALAREAADAAAREEVEAARNELWALQPHEEVMPEQVHLPLAPFHSTTARSLFPDDVQAATSPASPSAPAPKKMTPRKKQLATKVKKTPTKK